MKYSSYLLGALAAATCVSAARPGPKVIIEREPEDIPGRNKHLRHHIERRAKDPLKGQPMRADGTGSVFAGGTNHMLDLQNPTNLGKGETDNGVVVNLKWAFSDSKTRLLDGGWVREQVITDLPASTDMSAAQQHLTKGATRELHWHKVAEWGYVYAGEVLVSAVDENGKNEIQKIGVGDIWYFPKGAAHMIQGLAEHNEYLLVFDEADFDALGTTFMVDDWLLHTPKDILAKNFGVAPDFFDTLPEKDPYIIPPSAESQDTDITSPYGSLEGDSSFIYRLSQKEIPEVAGGGGTLAVVDSRNFPVSKTIAAAIVTLKPGALRELHRHPNAEEWLFFVSGRARATVFMGSATARSFNFRAGDTAVMPDNSGHYIENLSKTEDLVWIETYKSDRVAEIPLSQWLAVSPHDLVARTLNVSVDFVKNLKKEKQILIQ